jgi:ribosomal-protein-alanine N-acetyltransferase
VELARLPVLKTERLTLRVVGPEAAQACVNFQRENAAFLEPWEPPMRPDALDPAAVAAWRAHAVTHARNGTAYSFALALGDTEDESAPIAGWLNFTNIVRGVFQACYLGYKLDRRMQGHGLMTEAARAGIAFVFETVRLHRIIANYMPHNQRSAQVLRRLGFTVEGHAKSYLFIAGAWRDHVLTSLVNPAVAPPPGYE